MGPGVHHARLLVDIPLLKKVRWLEPSTPIYMEDLEAWEKFAGMRIGAGDALLVRGGRWAKREAEEGPWPMRTGGRRAACVGAPVAARPRCLTSRQRRGKRRATFQVSRVSTGRFINSRR